MKSISAGEVAMVYNMTILNQALKQAVSYSFANLVFLHIDSAEQKKKIESLKSDDYWITVDFIEPIKGKLGLIFANGLTSEIMETVVDSRSSLPDDMIEETLKEIQNTIAGRFLANLVSNEEQFRIGFPECQRVNNKTFSELNGHSIVIEFSTYDTQFYAYFQLQ
ncbi:MAG: chemotaxis protein CheX [Calditrichaeota bacterium]|nr:chemotaxis protein CheX [Calditrichota bacterium]